MKSWSEELFSPSLTVPPVKHSSIRYGGNPLEKSAFYIKKLVVVPGAGVVASAVWHHGKVFWIH